MVLALEALRGPAIVNTSAAWPVAQALTASIGLAIAWIGRERLRLSRVLLLAFVFQLAWVLLHLRLGVTGDPDPVEVYPAQGDVLLHGDYPKSEYPPGAVALFALETWLGGGSARTANAFLMIPFQLACVAAIWSLRTKWSAWLATFAALWPLNAFFWEFRFDLVPTAALVAGLALAWRQSWYESGFLLGLGTIAKWTPALAFIALLVWLVRLRQFSSARLCLAGFAIPVLLVNVPILVWRPSELVSAYTTQGTRTITAESSVFLPIHLIWGSESGYWYFVPADVPDGANLAAVLFQLAVVGTVIGCAAFARTRSGAVALAGLAPAFFLLTNRIFSPQFFVLILATYVVACALVVRTPRELFTVVGLGVVATTTNTILFQSGLGLDPVETFPHWMYVSALIFLSAGAAALWLSIRAVRQTSDPEPRPCNVAEWPRRSSSTAGGLADGVGRRSFR